MSLRCTFWSTGSALCNTLHMKALVRCGVNQFHTYLSHPTLGEATRLASMYLAMEKDPEGEVDRMSLSSSFGSSSTRLIISFCSSINTCVKTVETLDTLSYRALIVYIRVQNLPTPLRPPEGYIPFAHLPMAHHTQYLKVRIQSAP